MINFSLLDEYVCSFPFVWKPNTKTEIYFLAICQVMDEENLESRDEHEISVTVFVQDEAYRPIPVLYFFALVTHEELTDKATFPLTIMAALRDSKEFRDVCRDCYLNTVQPLETWSAYAISAF